MNRLLHDVLAVRTAPCWEPHLLYFRRPSKSLHYSYVGWRENNRRATGYSWPKNYRQKPSPFYRKKANVTNGSFLGNMIFFFDQNGHYRGFRKGFVRGNWFFGWEPRNTIVAIANEKRRIIWSGKWSGVRRRRFRVKSSPQKNPWTKHTARS